MRFEPSLQSRMLRERRRAGDGVCMGGGGEVMSNNI